MIAYKPKDWNYFEMRAKEWKADHKVNPLGTYQDWEQDVFIWKYLSYYDKMKMSKLGLSTQDLLNTYLREHMPMEWRYGYWIWEKV